MMDVYHEVDTYLLDRNFYDVTPKEQKGLVEDGLKEYVLKKIWERNPAKGTNLRQKKDEVSLDDLVTILGNLIPKEEHNDTLRHLTHYVLNVAGGMQGFSITWWEEKDPDLIKNPLVQFNIAGKWDSLTCHRETSYVQTFHFVNQIFREEFLEKSKDNKSLRLTATPIALTGQVQKAD